MAYFNPLGVTNYGATDASDYPITSHRPSLVINLELQEQVNQSPTSPIFESTSPSVTSSSSIAAAAGETGDNSKSKSSSSRSQTPGPQNEGFEE